MKRAVIFLAIIVAIVFAGCGDSGGGGGSREKDPLLVGSWNVYEIRLNGSPLTFSSGSIYFGADGATNGSMTDVEFAGSGAFWGTWYSNVDVANVNITTSTNENIIPLGLTVVDYTISTTVDPDDTLYLRYFVDADEFEIYYIKLP